MDRSGEIALLALFVLQLLQPNEAQQPRGSSDCSNNGELTSGGVCRCFPGYVGVKCGTNENLCKPPGGGANAAVCSGRGNCVAGYCDCLAIPKNSTQRYSGQFCECNDYSCPFSAGAICGGAERGVCNCGNCLCGDDYTGEDCSCSISTTQCVNSNGKICNGMGTCECGECKCTRPYYGPTCEVTFNKQTVCRTQKSCVQCRVYSSGPKSRDECTTDCSEMDLMIVDKTSEATGSVQCKKSHIYSDYDALCKFKDDDDCEFNFLVSLKYGNKLSVKAQKSKVCPSPSKGSSDIGNGVKTMIAATLFAGLFVV